MPVNHNSVKIVKLRAAKVSDMINVAGARGGQLVFFNALGDIYQHTGQARAACYLTC